MVPADCEDGFDRVVSYRVFESEDDLEVARGLFGRFESEVRGSPFPPDVATEFPEWALAGGHRLVTEVTRCQPYVVVRRRRGPRGAEYVKYFSSAAEGLREARVHEVMAERYPDSVVGLLDHGTVGTARSGRRRIPPPCAPSRCDDVEFYMVTEDPGEGYRTAWESEVRGDALTSFVLPLMLRLSEMKKGVGFAHWDLHGGNLLYNPGSGSFKMLDFGFGVVDAASAGVSTCAGSGAQVATNALWVPPEVLEDFGGSKKAFGFFYDLGRVMLHCNPRVRQQVLARYRAEIGGFLASYDAQIGDRARRRGVPSCCHPMDIPIDVDKCAAARFALDAYAADPKLRRGADGTQRAPPPIALPRRRSESGCRPDAACRQEAGCRKRRARCEAAPRGRPL